MGERSPRSHWRAIGCSVQGASHLRAGLPNQDALLWQPESGQGLPLIVAVSDGHGSARYFRSHVGAERAVQAAVSVVHDLLDGQPDPANLSAVKRTAEERLPREIVRRWREAVQEHVGQAPLTPDELGTLEGKDGARARQSVEQDPLLAYGATVLAVLLTESFILYLQLGDGDILVVAEDGAVSRPMQHDPRLFANQTTSLCAPDAWRDVQVRFQALVDPAPALILLSSDGYANSFVDEAAFLQVGSDLLDLVRAQGAEAVQASLPAWLGEASQAGSGDDITLGLLCRTENRPQPQPEPAACSLQVVNAPPASAELAVDLPDDYVWSETTPTRPPRIRQPGHPVQGEERDAHEECEEHEECEQREQPST